MTTTTTMSDTEQLIKSVSRALLRKPTFDPQIRIDQGRDGIDCTVRFDPYDIAVLIGKRGAMKFAIQNLIAHRTGKPHWEVNLHYDSTSVTTIARTTPRPPDMGLIQPVYDAIAAMIPGAVTKPLEISDTMVHGRLQIPEQAIVQIGYHMHRIFRAAGKSNGFPANLYLEHP